MVDNSNSAPAPEQALSATQPMFVLPRLSGSPTLKIVSIAGLFLIMLLPMAMVSSQIEERQQRQQGVLEEFRTSWGPSQVVDGPVLVIPYSIPSYSGSDQRTVMYLHIEPSALQLAAHLKPEVRRRGMFHAVVYASDVTAKGTFRIPREAVPTAAGADVRWADSFVVLRSSSWQGATNVAAFQWRDVKRPFGSPSDSSYQPCANLITARVPLDSSSVGDTEIPFEAAFEVRGTERFDFASESRNLDVTIDGPWETPSFGGARLPVRSDVFKDTGFAAEWRGGNELLGQPWSIHRDAGVCPALVPASGHQVGAELLEKVPTYRMVSRASKYGSLFLALSFVTYLLFEVVGRVRIHIVQYGLLGLSIALFALLLISLAEPLGFTAAYSISVLAIVAQTSAYTGSVTRSLRQSTIFGTMLTGLFGFLYVVLNQESYALLTGSIALFVILSILMFVTRRVDWTGRWGAPPAAS
jgi:inner membrane protein